MLIIKKTIIFFVILLALICFVLFYIIIPTVNEIKKLNKYIYQEQKDLEVKFQTGKKIREIRQDYLKIKPYMVQFNNIYLTEDKKIEFFTTLEKIAQKYNLEININLLPLEFSEIISFKFELSGEYFDFLKYLIDLEKLDYYVNIDEILIKDVAFKAQTESFSDFSFSKAYSKKEKFGKVKVILSGKVYQKEKNFLDGGLF